jgi:hypothetical protein
MTGRKHIGVSLVISLLLMTACLLWALSGFERKIISTQVADGAMVPAGEMVDGRVLEQNVDFSGLEMGGDIYLGIRFATYGRRNLGSIKISLQSDDLTQSHEVAAKDLKDNSIRYFKFSGFDTPRAKLYVEGINGMPKRSPTVWCHSSSDRKQTVVVDGEASDRKVDVWVATEKSNQMYVLSRIGVTGFTFLSIIFLVSVFPLVYIGIGSHGSGNEIKTSAIGTGSSITLIRKIVLATTLATITTSLVLVIKKSEYDFIPIENPDISNLVSAPPLVEERTIEQEIEISPQLAEGSFALGLTFGTYMRTNTAKFQVSLSQDGHTQHHIVKSKTLDDNKERQFVFSGFEAGSVELTLSGKNGDESNSPTIWLTPANEVAPAKIDGEIQPQRVLIRRYYVVERPVVGDLFYQWFVVVFVSVVLLCELPFFKYLRSSKAGVR